MSEAIGLLGAAIAAVFWGSQFVPFKISKKKPSAVQYQFMTTIGIFLLSLVLVPILSLSYSINLAGIIGGFLWASGNFLATKSVEKAGLAKTMPVWSAGVVLVSSFIGLAFFQEIVQNLFMAIFGAAAIILGVLFVSKGYGKMKEKSDLGNLGNFGNLGIVFSILAGLIFGLQLVPMKLANLTAVEFFFPMSLGILIAGTIIFLLHREKIKNIAIPHGLLGGAIWNIGNLGSIFSVMFLGLAIGFPITQLSSVLAVAWGILAFKEIRERRKRLYVFLGAIIVILGAIALTFSK